ncbi:MAG: class I SAM-dependent methyltransferase [Longimicrobiales bacterium]
MISTVPADRSNGYEAVSSEFIALRTRSSVGAATVRDWAQALPHGGAVLDLGCGHGVPISRVLVDAGFTVYGVDSSPSMIAAFRTSFPDALAECAAVEESRFFGRAFDAVVAWGLMFLLTPDAQTNLIHKVARALKRGGRFLFTAPGQASEWPDSLTGRTSLSLGSDRYRHILEAAGLVVLGEADDEGENHYYFMQRFEVGGG